VILGITDCSNALPETHSVWRGKSMDRIAVAGEEIAILLENGGEEREFELKFLAILVMCVLVRQVFLDSVDQFLWSQKTSLENFGLRSILHSEHVLIRENGEGGHVVLLMSLRFSLAGDRRIRYILDDVGVFCIFWRDGATHDDSHKWGSVALINCL